MKKPIQHAMGLLLCLACCTALLGVGKASAADMPGCHEKEAQTLKNFGLFLGTYDGFALEQIPTRAQGAVLLVRMLGEETAALEYAGEHPFTDVPLWCDRHVAYAYHRGYIAGTSATTYAPDRPLTRQQYTVFLLRALGYREDDGDFTYGTALQEAENLGLSVEGEGFTRGDVVHLSYEALQLKTKNGRPLLTELFCKNPSMMFLGSILDSELSYVLEQSGEQDSSYDEEYEYEYEEVYEYEEEEWEEKYPVKNHAVQEFSTRTVRTNCLTIVDHEDLQLELEVEGEVVTLHAWSSGAADRYSLTRINRDLTTGNPRTETSDELRDSSGTAMLVVPAAEDGWETGIGINVYYGDTITTPVRFLAVEDGEFVFESAERFNQSRYSMGERPEAYLASRNDIRADNEQVKALAEQLFSADMSDYERGLAAFEWVSRNISYRGGSSWKVGDVLESRESICQGYANLMSALLVAGDVPARVVVGESLLVNGIGTHFSPRADATNHAWVMFHADGRWVICDPTAGGSGQGVLDCYFDMDEVYADSVMKALYLQ